MAAKKGLSASKLQFTSSYVSVQRLFSYTIEKRHLVPCVFAKSEWYPYTFHVSLSVINCTSVNVDPRGPLRMSSCDNHYGAKCNFSCAIGYRLNGSSTVTCVAPGNQHPGVWNSTIPICEGKLENVQSFKLKLNGLKQNYSTHLYPSFISSVAALLNL